jgi:hypothetical protein
MQTCRIHARSPPCELFLLSIASITNEMPKFLNWISNTRDPSDATFLTPDRVRLPVQNWLTYPLVAYFYIFPTIDLNKPRMR